jgi:hypothetical protein
MIGRFVDGGPAMVGGWRRGVVVGKGGWEGKGVGCGRRGCLLYLGQK